MEKDQTLLPIGTVVSLNNLNQPMMIYGRMQTQNGAESIWDYVGCPYPLGFISKEYNVFFDHKQIEAVLFKGYESPQEQELRDALSGELARYRNKDV
ncbi:DUF4176 domain-containing protein [Mesobacillus foraminis]|uniref:DUF4176 domain-containing protein n=1 Tax=Mesobacillus foraminis TaxID=279826 RepID=UPI0039A29E9F